MTHQTNPIAQPPQPDPEHRPAPTAFVGCDVGKTHIVVFDGRTGQTTTWRNTYKHLARLAATLDSACLVVCEATGGYETALLNAVTQAGHQAHRADARKVKAFIRSFGTLGKTDAIDAHALARYGRERHHGLARWTETDPVRAELHALIQARRDIVAEQTAWTNRSQAPGAGLVHNIVQSIRAALERQIKRIDARIQAILQASTSLQQAVKVLRSIKGIGVLTAATLLALLPELGRMDRRHAPALAGLAPHPQQSGQQDGYRRVRGGRPDIKRILFMAALSAARHDPDISPFYQRLVAAGKPKLVALTAAMRKIIVIANARLRDAGLQLS